MDKQRTIRLSEQDVQAIAAIREEYGFTSDSEALRFALHTLWREIKRERNPTQAPNKDSPFIPSPKGGRVFPARLYKDLDNLLFLRYGVPYSTVLMLVR